MHFIHQQGIFPSTTKAGGDDGDDGRRGDNSEDSVDEEDELDVVSLSPMVTASSQTTAKMGKHINMM